MKKVPNIWLTILLALIAASGLSLLLPKDSELYLSQRFWITKTFAPARYNVIVMGDSRVYRGVSPAIMEKELKEFKVLNFAYSNGGLNPEMFSAAENKLNETSRFKVIVLGISANTVTGYSRDNRQYLQELSRTREQRFEAIYLNSVKYWFSPTLPEKLLDELKNKQTDAFYTNKYFMNGYVASIKFPIDTTEAILSYQKDFNQYKVENKYLDELYFQVKRWTNQNIIVFGFRPPVSLPMRQLEDSLGRYNEEQIRTEFEKAGGHWIDLNPNLYKTYDGSHVTIESARKLSIKIASEIEKLVH